MDNWLIIRKWLLDYSLPLWASTGFDDRTNTFMERLSLEGASMPDVPRRAMVQARQIYSYSVAERYGWLDGASDLVARSAKAFANLYFEADHKPGWAMSVDSSGQVADGTRDLYAHAFVLLGLASAFRSTNYEYYLMLADKTLAFLDAEMALGQGGYCPTLPPLANLLLTQNPHMHLLEALLILYEAAPNEDYRQRAQAMVTLFEKKLLTESTGTLTEYFHPGWIPADVSRGITFEPGHHYEWMWLLRRYSDLFREPLSDHFGTLERTAALWGRSQDGFLWSEVRSDGAVTDASFRLWPHTEATKAAVSLASLGGASEMLGLLYRGFLKEAFPGGWNDRLSSTGKVLVDYMPASSLYHLVCAFGECEVFYKTNELPPDQSQAGYVQGQTSKPALLRD